MTTENQIAENESFETALAPEPIKRKRSSILKQPDKRSRDSRTVSFSDKHFYKELYQDGTCDITNIFLGEDMDITMMDVIDPAVDCNNRTIDTSVDMSMDQTIVGTQSVDLSMDQTVVGTQSVDMSMDQTTIGAQSFDMTLVPLNNNQSAAATTYQDTTLNEKDMISVNPMNQTKLQTQQLSQQQQQQQQLSRQKLQISRQENQLSRQEHQLSRQEHHISRQEHQLSRQEHQMSRQEHHQSQTQHQLSQTQHQLSQTQHQLSQHEHQLSQRSQDSQTSKLSQLSQISQISEISSLDDTLFGAYHDSNNLSMVSNNRSSGVESLMHNIEALNECVSKIDHDTEDCRRRLDAEIKDLLEFYRHIVNKDDPYEFAIAIFGLRHSLWLIIKVNPDTYPFEKLKLRFAVSKKDRHLYPFKEYAEAVRRYTKEGRHGYLKRFVISAQKFRRFLKRHGPGKTTNS